MEGGQVGGAPADAFQDRVVLLLRHGGGDTGQFVGQFDEAVLAAAPGEQIGGEAAQRGAQQAQLRGQFGAPAARGHGGQGMGLRPGEAEQPCHPVAVPGQFLSRHGAGAQRAGVDAVVRGQQPGVGVQQVLGERGEVEAGGDDLGGLEVCTPAWAGRRSPGPPGARPNRVRGGRPRSGRAGRGRTSPGRRPAGRCGCGRRASARPGRAGPPRRAVRGRRRCPTCWRRAAR